MRKEVDQGSILLFPRTAEPRPEPDNHDEVLNYILTSARDFSGRVVLRPGPRLLDAVLPTNSMHSLFRLPARRAFLVMVHLICLCLAGGIGRSAAAPAALAIPGAVTVNIKPADAVRPIGAGLATFFRVRSAL